MGWLRASVLGANDGIISVASLVVGVTAAGAEHRAILLTGVAGLVAGMMSIAASEYVSVQSQADTERADTETEKHDLQTEPERKLTELTSVYVRRGLDDELARRVAERLTTVDALGAHVRDELGITDSLRARPIQAALTSAASFAVGAIIPIAVAGLVPAARVGVVASATALAALVLLGGTAAYAGRAPVVQGALRVAFWGALAMGMTAAVGMLVGTGA